MIDNIKLWRYRSLGPLSASPSRPGFVVFQRLQPFAVSRLVGILEENGRRVVCHYFNLYTCRLYYPGKPRFHSLGIPVRYPSHTRYVRTSQSAPTLAGMSPGYFVVPETMMHPVKDLVAPVYLNHYYGPKNVGKSPLKSITL